MTPPRPAPSERLTIDIRTRFLADDTRVYILFPGEGYRYYRLMESSSSVFLQLPAFPLFKDNMLTSDADIIRRIVVSDRIMAWHNSKDNEPEPTRDPSEVRHYRKTEARLQLASFITHFFSQPKKGDIIIVPCQSQEDMVLFGELADEPFVSVGTESPRDFGEPIPARPVKWIARIQRSSVPRWLDQKIPSPNPLRQIEKSRHKQIFDLMYERYFYEGRFIVKFKTEREKFNSLDSYIINQFFLYISALHENLHENNISDVKDKSLYEAVSSIGFSDDIPDQRISIHSKGYIVNDASNVIPLVCGVMMHLALGLDPAAAQAQPPHITNTADGSSASKQCVLDIEQEVAAEMKMMGEKRWEELYCAGKKANQSTGIDAGMNSPRAPAAPAKPNGDR